MEINGIIYIFDDDEEMYKLWEIERYYRKNGGNNKFIEQISSLVQNCGKITYHQFEVVKKIYNELGLYKE